MWHIIFLLSIALVWIIFASVEDIKKREVSNWLNFSLVIFVLGFRFFYSFFSAETFNFFYQGLIGFGIFFVLGNVFYYARVFAGGDAKLMIALGAILSLSNDFFVNIGFFICFLFLFFVVGAFYGLIISSYLTLTHFKNFQKEFKKQFEKRKNFVLIFLIIGIGIFGFGFWNSLFFVLGAMIFFLPYFYVYAKAIDEVCMVKKVNVDKLTEGDWLYENIKIGNKIIKSDWNGLTKKDLELLKKKSMKVKIRQGIPFIPVFLISFILFVLLYYLGIIETFWNSFF